MRGREMLTIGTGALFVLFLDNTGLSGITYFVDQVEFMYVIFSFILFTFIYISSLHLLTLISVKLPGS